MGDLELHTRQVWIFDLDGTLTRAAHDFRAIRAELGLPSDEPILEALDRLHDNEAAWRMRRLDEIEWETAGRAVRAPGAEELLEHLTHRGRDLGVVTRNSRSSAMRTLRTAGLDRFFRPEEIIGRDDAAPKPAPDGVDRLLAMHDAAPGSALIVGDYRYDMLAGRAAGVACVLVDGRDDIPWRHHADVVVGSLHQVHELATAT